MYRIAIVLVALACATDALGQSTSTTMDMGGGMTHVDTMGPSGAMSSSNCMNVGGGMAKCNTMDMSQPQRANPMPDMSRPQTNGTTTSFIGGLIGQSRERSFQKKVGQMLAAGDCIEASTFAHAHGHEAQSDQILRSCRFNQPAAANTEAAPRQGVAQPIPLTERLRLAAVTANAATPIALDEITTVSKVEAIGSQILLTATVNATGTTISEPFRSKVQNRLCADQSAPALLTAGASIRIKYFEPNGKEIGSVMVTRNECGL
ncbi:hypothetical protein LWE61_03280 [Sphingobium sufflavum]|uniref:hypothetical protein n=1 Tax=Sphingobium sufflavum TaxID=1129547 RepID=UPI001F1816B8|nr:hypothetical protein [Sphingobium sufflavum]MCE7795575.1 hypothetical protein [Sphingobium sufflavum]